MHWVQMLLKRWRAAGVTAWIPGPAWNVAQPESSDCSSSAYFTSHLHTRQKAALTRERERAQLGDTEMTQTRGGFCVGCGGCHLGSMSATVPVSEFAHPYAC